MNNGKIFTIRARRCKRCGRLLTSSEALQRGYGCQCAAREKAEKREREPLPGQMNIMDFLKDQNMED